MSKLSIIWRLMAAAGLNFLLPVFVLGDLFANLWRCNKNALRSTWVQARRKNAELEDLWMELWMALWRRD